MGTEMNYTIVTTENQLHQMLSQLSSATVIFVDTETTHLDPYRAKLLMIQIHAESIGTFVVDCTTGINVKLLNTLWNNDSLIKVFHNAAYDVKIIFHNCGVLIKNVYDTMITERMLTAGFIKLQASLLAVAERRLGITLNKAVRATFTESEISELSKEQIEYAVNDVLVLPEIRRQQLAEIEQHQLQNVHALEMELCPITSLIEYTGMPFDASHLHNLEPKFAHIIKEAERVLQDMFINAGVCNQIIFSKEGYTGFNPSSTQQMIELFNKVGIGIESLNAKLVMQWDFKNRRTAKNFAIDFTDFSDDIDISDAMDKFGSFENKYLQAYSFYTAAKKIHGTYVKALPLMENPVTKRIHCSFNQYGAATGRFSSSSPNLQNIPSDQKMRNLGVDSSIRHSFKVKDGRNLIIADYSTIELVIIADASGDQGLINNLEDLHTFVAREVLGVKDINEKNKKDLPYRIWRDIAKMVNYSIAYNVGGNSLSKQMSVLMAPLGEKMSSERADKIIDDWKGRFPDAAEWLKNSARSVVLYGEVTDSFGRKRFWDRTEFYDKWKRASAEREAMNFPIQALSASMVKLALVGTHNRLNLKKGRIVSTVHDEIIVEAGTAYATEAAQILKEEMEKAAQRVLPNLGNTVLVTPAISDKYDK
jgi:DNA polymerase-1